MNPWSMWDYDWTILSPMMTIILTLTAWPVRMFFLCISLCVCIYICILCLFQPSILYIYTCVISTGNTSDVLITWSHMVVTHFSWSVLFYYNYFFFIPSLICWNFLFLTISNTEMVTMWFLFSSPSPFLQFSFYFLFWLSCQYINVTAEMLCCQDESHPCPLSQSIRFHVETRCHHLFSLFDLLFFCHCILLSLLRQSHLNHMVLWVVSRSTIHLVKHIK